MQITCDPAKNDANVVKHRISLLLASKLDWPAVMAAVDARTDYGELREIGFGILENRLYCVVFTQRSDTRKGSAHVVDRNLMQKRSW